VNPIIRFATPPVKPHAILAKEFSYITDWETLF